MDKPLVLITRTSLTSSRVRCVTKLAQSLHDFLYQKKLPVTSVEYRRQSTLRLVSAAENSLKIQEEEYEAAFNVTAAPDALKTILEEWMSSL